VKVSARALDSLTMNPFPSHFLTHKMLFCPACCQAAWVAASWAGEMASMHAEEEEREGTCPPRLCKEILGDIILRFKCKNGLALLWFCFSDHH